VRLAGVLAAAGWVVVLLLTHLALPGGARPLYDGFAPPAPYKWVNPPKELRDTNIAPSDGSGTVARTDGSGASLAFETGDGQASLTAELGALGLAAGETGAGGRLVPLDPTTFGGWPQGLAPSGNVYRLTVVANPSGREVTAFAKPASISLEIANSAGTTLLTSRDGKAWTRVSSTIGQPFVIANTTTTGYYVLAGPAGLLPSLEPASGAKRSGGLPAGLIAGGVVALLVAGGVVLLLRRERG
jgi:hypothetical protein